MGEAPPELKLECLNPTIIHRWLPHDLLSEICIPVLASHYQNSGTDTSKSRHFHRKSSKTAFFGGGPILSVAEARRTVCDLAPCGAAMQPKESAAKKGSF